MHQPEESTRARGSVHRVCVNGSSITEPLNTGSMTVPRFDPLPRSNSCTPEYYVGCEEEAGRLVELEETLTRMAVRKCDRGRPMRTISNAHKEQKVEMFSRGGRLTDSFRGEAHRQASRRERLEWPAGSTAYSSP